MKNSSVILTGGKTGGHIYPALAIGGIISKEYDVNLYYIGAADGMESKILENENITFYGMKLAPFVDISFLKKIKGFFINILGFFYSFKIIYKIKPKLVIGTGGFVAGPVLSAAYVLRVPIIIHEQNVVPGFTNKVLSHISKEIWMTFNESANFFPKGKRKVLTGMPLRKNFQMFTKEQGRDFFTFNNEDKILLITGGSQGSKIINENVVSIYKDIIKSLGYKIIHITGPKFYDEIIDNIDDEVRELITKGYIRIISYLQEMELALNTADIVISRSGASFICELIATNSYSIQIPMKKSAGNHQLKNAKAIEKAGLGKIIEEDDLTSNSLFETIKSLQSNIIHNTMKNSVGILFGDNTKEIIRKEVQKYLK